MEQEEEEAGHDDDYYDNDDFYGDDDEEYDDDDKEDIDDSSSSDDSASEAVATTYDDFDAIDEEEGEQARHIECQLLCEVTLYLLEDNDPDVSGLEVERRTWICRAGPIIRDSKSLRKIHIIIDSGETDGTWLGELLQHLRRNRSIESLTVHLRPTIYFCNDIMTNSHYDYQLFEVTDNLHLVQT